VLLLDEIVERGSAIQSNRTLAVIRKMFNFALSRGILDTSPCVAIEAAAKENRRERFLNEKEIEVFWVKLDKAAMSDSMKMLLKLLLITGHRKGEIASAKWEEFDLSKKWWTIPAEKSKNSLSHRVPLTGIAMEILNDLKKQNGDSEYLFPSPHNNSSSINGSSVDHAVRKNADAFGIDHFTPHDLRRTAATHMTDAGIPREPNLARVLNRAEKGVTAVYDRYSYDKEKKYALETWARKLEYILYGKNKKIVSLRK
jgi:integrase